MQNSRLKRPLAKSRRRSSASRPKELTPKTPLHRPDRHSPAMVRHLRQQPQIRPLELQTLLGAHPARSLQLRWHAHQTIFPRRKATESQPRTRRPRPGARHQSLQAGQKYRKRHVTFDDLYLGLSLSGWAIFMSIHYLQISADVV